MVTLGDAAALFEWRHAPGRPVSHTFVISFPDNPGRPLKNNPRWSGDASSAGLILKVSDLEEYFAEPALRLKVVRMYLRLCLLAEAAAGWRNTRGRTMPMGL